MKSYWIWNRGDYALYHTNLVNSRREGYGCDYPAFWRNYSVESNVKFYAELSVPEDGMLILHLHGKGYISVDGRKYPAKQQVPVTKGKHYFVIAVFSLAGLPSAYVESNVISTDSAWKCRDEYNREETVGYSEDYTRADQNPEKFPFAYERVSPVLCERVNGGVLFDFGREIFGYLYIRESNPNEKLHVSYGESEEEALDLPFSYIREDVTGKDTYKLTQRAFRYIFILGTENPSVEADCEYLPLKQRGRFTCGDADMQRVLDVCGYTLRLTAREVLIEALKRDRWLWGGDEYQAAKFANYLFCDKSIVERSIIGLRGKEPFKEHINTITDYSFLWVIGLWEYYETYGDAEFIRFIYPRARSLMDFSAKRVNEEGFIIGVGADWIFIDWADMEKSGPVCAEQILWIAANRAMERLSAIAKQDGTLYRDTAEKMQRKTDLFFWDEQKGAYIDSYTTGNNHVTRHANIFAVLYDVADAKKTESICKNVLDNPEIAPITTPYFEGYELDVWGKAGRTDCIEKKIDSYWKKMIDLGATTVWEAFDPEMKGAEHYAMYGSPYEKSLCHAWGAAPIYLFGKYFLGVTPTTPGFETFAVRPCRGKYPFVEGTVPFPDGEVRVYLSEEELRVCASRTGGTLHWDGKAYSLIPGKEIQIRL